MTFDRVAEIWSSMTESRVPHRRAFVVETQLDALLVEGVDVEDPFRPDVVGRGKTISWVYIECPNGDRMVAKIRETASDGKVMEVLSRLAEIAMT
ncbi:MAG: hypothetical protein QGH33_14675 [Pirellulaceae bacterium]|jgi:hypothetical protein|nr:hypothetical protein [Pirellulaceae bacterium]HJN10710.1 hypothetical protein [Pirellulaceae bacterium]